MYLWKGTSSIVVLQIFTTSLSFTLIDDDALPYSENCVCVPYWQCKEDYYGLIQDGMDIMDVRTAKANYPIHCTGKFDVCCIVKCGQYTNPRINAYKERTVNNVTRDNKANQDTNLAQFAEFSWMLGIIENRRYICGASLIHTSVALTVAHCICATRVYIVRAGEWNWDSLEESVRHQDRTSKKVIIHPNYQPVPLQNDIALLILESPFTIALNVGIVCIPPPRRTYDSSNCIATGWGGSPLSRNLYQPHLKKIELSIVANDRCAATLANKLMKPNFKLHQSFICAGGENKDMCKGDGGGPLICPIATDPYRYEQVGIVSWGLTCGTLNVPGVYVNVALFRDWIDSQMILNGLDANVYKA